MSVIARSARLTRARPTSLPQYTRMPRRFESADGPNSPDHAQRASPEKSSTSPTFYGVGAILAIVCGYYFIHSDRRPGEGQARIKEIRRENPDPQNEYRDPRDSPVKTPEQKKLKEEGKLK